MSLNRAYSTLEVKAIDEEKREITGIASTPTPDRYDDIVEPKGAVFKLPLPFLWQHQHDQPIGHVTKAKVTSAGIEVTVQLAQQEEEGKLRERLEEAWQSIKSGLVRGLSIGFLSIESANIEDSWGRRFLKWDWLELSAVTVPANAEASIQTIKSIDQRIRAASGREGPPVVRLMKAPPGVTGKPSSKPAERGLFHARKEGNMNVQEQIKQFETTRASKVAAMEEIMSKAAETGETLDSEQSEQYDTLQSEVDAIDTHLRRLKAHEKTLIARATPLDPAAGESQQRATEIRGGGVQVKATQKLDKGIEFARYAMCRLAAKGNPDMAFRLAERHYADNERVVRTLKAQAEGADLAMIMKAVVEAGTTLDSTWAAPLVDYQAFAGDFVEYLRPRTIIGQFGQGGVPSLNEIPFNVRIAGQTTGGNAYWVGEGAPKPLTAFDFTATELRWAKVAAISVLTNELIRFSNPSAERLVRDGLADAVTSRIDLDFVDPAKTAVANVSPASITNGATAVPSSGTDAQAVQDDLRALWAPFIAARNPPRTAVYIMDSTTALALSLMRNPLGQPEYPGLTMNGGLFNGVPVIVSDYLPVDSTGSIVVLVNARDVWLADDGQVTIDASQEASLQMLDNPTNNSSSGTATSMVSMFQTNSTAFRAERYINWARRRSSGVAYLTGVNWGASGS